MPFYEAVVESDAPDTTPRRDLEEYREYLDTLKPGKQHYLYVLTGDPVMRKVAAVDDKGDALFTVDTSTGRKVPLYATEAAEDGTPGEPKPAGVDGVKYILEDTGRGKTEMSHASGLVAAGAELDINVNVKATQMGHGKTVKNPETGVIEWKLDDSQPEKTRLRVIRSVKRTDTPEGKLRKTAALAERRRRDMQDQLKRAVTAPASYKKELQDRMKRYAQEASEATAKLAELEAKNGQKTEQKAPVAS